MTFRQDAIAHRQFQIFVIIITFVCLAISLFLDFTIAAFSIIGCIILWLIFIFNKNNFITINETGISCHSAKEQLWEYTWDDIAELRKGSYLRSSGIYVIAYSKSGEPEQYAVSGHCFQLGKAAKQAIEKYYKPIAELPKQ